jgi:hypothetical protein
MKRYLLVWGLIFLCSEMCLHAQDRCGTKTPPLPYMVDSAIMSQSRLNATSPLLMKVFVHVVSTTNGFNPAAGDSSIMRQLKNMQEFYAPHGICFLLVGKEQINSDDLDNHNSSTEEADVSSRAIFGTMNIFIHRTLFNNDGGLNGVAYGIPSYYLSVEGSAIRDTLNRSTTAHEMGHCFGLYHTFERNYGEENIDRSGACLDCFQTGDLLCDTPADPHTDNNDTGNDIDANCNYSDNSQFQYCNGDKLFYQMDPRNVMAYGSRPCRVLFTTGQGGRARTTINNNANLLAAIAPDDEDITTSRYYDSGRPIFAARTAVQVNSSSFTVTGAAMANFSSNSLVILKPGVTLSPSGNGYSELRISTLCQ